MRSTKFIIFFSLLCCLSSFVYGNFEFLYDRNIKYNIETELSIGWKRYYRKMDSFIDKNIISEKGETRGNLVGGTLQAKYQVPNQFYCKAQASYYFSQKLKNNVYQDGWGDFDSKVYQRSLGGAFGYTFEYPDVLLLIAPFISLIYVHNTCHFKGNLRQLKFQKKVGHSGVLFMIGADAKKDWSENWSSNLNVKAGFAINVIETFKTKSTFKLSKEQLPLEVLYAGKVPSDEVQTVELKERRRPRTKLSYLAILQPINYRYKASKVGIQLSHEHYAYTNSLHKTIIETYGIAAFASLIF